MFTQSKPSSAVHYVSDVDQQHHTVIQEMDLPDLPEVVQVNDILPNFRILANDEMLSAMNYLQNQPDGVYEAQECKTTSDVVKFDGEYYAIFGKKALGDGGYAIVRLVERFSDGKLFAMKRHGVGGNTSSHIDQIFMENLALNEIGEEVSSIFLFEAGKVDKEYLRSTIFREFHPGFCLDDYLKKRKYIPDYRIIDIAIQAAQAIKLLHKKGFLHLDIKLDNFIYDPRRHQLKMIDYANSKPMDADGKARCDLVEVQGLYASLAPEIKAAIKSDQVIYDQYTEIYALGYAFAELFGFKLNKNNEIESGVPASVLQQEMSELVIEMLSGDPYLRPNINEVVECLARVKKKMNTIEQVNVAIIDINELLTCPPLVSLNYPFVTSLFDEVIFVCYDNAPSATDVCRSIEHIRSNNATIANKIYKLPHYNALLPLMTLLDDEKESEVMRNYHYVTTQPLGEKFQKAFYGHISVFEIDDMVFYRDAFENVINRSVASVSDNSFVYVSAALQAEKLRLQHLIECDVSMLKDYLPTNEALLDNCRHIDKSLDNIAACKADDSLSPHTLSRKLAILQRALTSSSIAMNSIFKNNKPEEVVQQLREKIIPPAQYTKL